MKAQAAVKVVQGEVLAPSQVNPHHVVGINIQDMVQQGRDAIEAFKRSSKGKVIVHNGINFEELGKEAAELFLANEQEIAAARGELEQQARVSRGELWLAYAMQVSTDAEAQIMTQAFKAACVAKGHKRAASDASDFKTFCLAYLKSPTEVIGAMAESKGYHEAMAALRDIKNDGQTKSRKNQREGRNVKPNDKSMKKVIHYIGNMDVKQLTAVWKAGLSRAKALRKAGEVFEAFK